MRHRLRIAIVAPAGGSTRGGNRVTALRWARILRGLGHRVRMGEKELRHCDLLVALHAGKSHSTVAMLHDQRPEVPIVVALTGTDIYGASGLTGNVARSCDLAWRLVALQRNALDLLPPGWAVKTRVIHQSARAPAPASPRPSDEFRICVVGHLRALKDPFRAADAAALLPKSSRVRVLHIGGALEPALALDAAQRVRDNPRYRWLGSLTRRETLALMASAHALVLSSTMEGGANVVGEAIACGVPVLASAIPGSLGLLGADYPGLFAPGDTAALARLIARAESDPAFYALITRRCADLKFLFDPARERGAFEDLLHELAAPAHGRLRVVEATAADTESEALGQAVRAGLAGADKSLPWRFFYDADGSRWFDALSEQPEYYLPASEREILAARGPDIMGRFAQTPTLLELGSGSARKTALLIEAGLAKHAGLLYVPVDVSQDALDTSARILLERFARLHMTAVAGAYDQAVPVAFDVATRPRLVLFLGSNIGNFSRLEAARFLRGVRRHMGRGDRLLVGVDLRKDAATLERAYDDAAGLTARFNLNLLVRINRELGANFALGDFRHKARFDPEQGRVQMFLVSRRDHTVSIPGVGLTVSFRQGECIHTEDSFKYSAEEIRVLATSSGFALEAQWLDRAQRFSLTLLRPEGLRS